MPLLPTPRKLKSGIVWYGQIKLLNGDWKQFNTGCADERKARKVVEIAEREIAAGRNPFSERKGGILLVDLAEEYLAETRLRNRRPGSPPYYTSLRS